MMFDGVNLIAVAVAAIGSFIFGSIWYGVLGKAWMKAASLSEKQTKPDPLTLAIAFVCQLVMAFVFAGIIYHAGESNIRTGIISALMIWVGIVLTTQIINHRFQGRPWSLTVIDGGHWLGVLVVQGILIGWLS
jgi:membrane protein YdbS with pleckstrin-like domain